MSRFEDIFSSTVPDPSQGATVHDHRLFFLSTRSSVPRRPFSNVANLAEFKRQSRALLPLSSASALDQFRHTIARMIHAAMSGQPETPLVPPQVPPGLKKIAPYWFPYHTMAKERWLGREILEIVSTEFRDRSMEYYRYALESGVTTVNGKVAKPDTIVQNGDRIENVVHRHEPPITSTPVKIISHDKERHFIVVNKPGSIPVHASGRYYKHSLVEILKDDFGCEKVYTINRLDRLTSGLMIIPLISDLARSLTAEFQNGTIRKEYIARAKGKFPEEEVTCDQPLLTVDRQMGLNIVHPEGKPALTIFKRLHYDANTDSSVIHCRPMTGRSHQIRVHLQFLGHPIANDPIYSEEKIWGINLGKSGIDVVPNEERAAPVAPEHLQSDDSPEALSSDTKGGDAKALPRETGHDIGMSSPVPLSSEAVGIITRLRNMKDEGEDWSRWRDVVFRAKGALTPPQYVIRKQQPPRSNRRKRGGPMSVEVLTEATVPEQPTISTDTTPAAQTPDAEPPAQLETENILARLSAMELEPSKEEGSTAERAPESGTLYCPECYLPLHPDPKPEKLYIFLHALKYTTSLGSFETEMPEWAAEGWEWEQSDS